MDQDLPTWARPLTTTCAALEALFFPHVEIVLHDLKRDAIIAIWNPTSGRSAGDPSLLEELPASWREHPVQGPYRKVSARGDELAAVSAVVHDDRGQARGLLCLNLDRSPLLHLADALAAIAAPLQPAPPELFARDWREQIAQAIDEACRRRGLDRGRLSRRDRVELVGELDDRGLFATRRAADHAAAALGVSRATIYALRKEAHDDARAA